MEPGLHHHEISGQRLAAIPPDNASVHALLTICLGDAGHNSHHSSHPPTAASSGMPNCSGIAPSIIEHLASLPVLARRFNGSVGPMMGFHDVDSHPQPTHYSGNRIGGCLISDPPDLAPELDTPLWRSIAVGHLCNTGLLNAIGFAEVGSLWLVAVPT